MRKHADGLATLQLPGTTVSDVFGQFLARYPAAGALLRDAKGHLLPHINVFVNGDDIRWLDGEKTTVGDRDEVHVIPAMAGGAR
jgi:molybdopterin converting factor small subunit